MGYQDVHMVGVHSRISEILGCVMLGYQGYQGVWWDIRVCDGAFSKVLIIMYA